MRVRFGMVGTGFWAEDVHLPVLREHAGVDLVGVWGRDAGKAQAVAGRFGAQGFARYEDMLEAVDAVSLAVPPDIQPDLAIRAARARKHLLLEKPLALQPEAARAVAAEVESAGVAAVVFFTRRFEADVANWLAAIAETRDWQSATAQFFTGAMLPGTPYTNSLWRQQRGALWDIGPHAISVLLAVLGDVVAVAATPDEPKITRLRLTHLDGRQSDVALSFHAGRAAQGESYIFRSASRVARLEVAPALRRSAFHHALDALIAAARTGVPHSCDVRFGLRVLRVLVAAEASLRQGVAVPVVD